MNQILVYSMQLQARQDVAMILPLPVPPASPEDAVRFIDLQAYPDFFTDLRRIFQPTVRSFGGDDDFAPQPAGARSLKVHEVGLFEASFVPAVADFGRLDPRFRLPAKVWDELPQFRDWGFAVFKLKLGQAQARPQQIHPMAFEFPRRDPKMLFFPTVHVHDGAVHPEAEFDHNLYCQLDKQVSSQPGRNFLDEITLRLLDEKEKAWFDTSWDESNIPLAAKLDLSRAAGILSPDARVYRNQVTGTLPNQDTILNLDF